ncbi:phospholipase D-like domain-containing protein [Pseudoroseicyclus sp. H15]
MADLPPVPETTGRLQLLITAAEAYPAFERLILRAEREVVMGFRIFDPRTLLRTPEAQKVGTTWSDLIVDALRRGVRVTLWLSDFDAAAATDLHISTWNTVRILCGVREMAGEAGKNLTIHPRLHPARPGTLPRLFFSPIIRMRLSSVAKQAMKEAREGESRGLSLMPGVRAMLKRRFGDGMPSWPVSHHQKLASVDGRWLYIGGLDLNERRWDTLDHDQGSEGTWHDIQALIDDPALAEAGRAHLMNFDDVTEARARPVAAPGLLRTISARRKKSHFFRFSPREVLKEIEECHHVRIAESSHLIYLETQFFRDRGLARALAERAQKMSGLKLILVVPGAPETVAFNEPPDLDGRYGDYLQLWCIEHVRRAFGPERLLIASPAQPRQLDERDSLAPRAKIAGAPIIYLHAKLSVFDGRSAIVSSANLNGRSLHWDTEAGVELTGQNEVDLVRRRIQKFWLNEPADLFPLDDAFQHWTDRVEENGRLPPEKRRGFLVPYDEAAAVETSVRLPGVPEAMV